MRILTENLGYKLFSVATACGLWYMFADETELATSVPVSVRFLNSPNELELSSESPDRLFLRMRGPTSRLRTEELAGTAITLDLSPVQAPGEQTIAIDKETLRLPPGVTLLSVVPSQMRLRFERRGFKSVPVEPKFFGPPQKGYRIVQQYVIPQQLTVTGPESRVEVISSVQTDPINLSSTVSSAEFRVNAYSPHPQVRIQTSPAVVTVRLSLEKIPQ